jgi:hypothetical protein
MSSGVIGRVYVALTLVFTGSRFKLFKYFCHARARMSPISGDSLDTCVIGYSEIASKVSLRAVMRDEQLQLSLRAQSKTCP